jgi:citrate lyase subunit beta/citryl-CoA lyase
MDIADQDGLAAEAGEAVSVGFDDKVAIHPSQVPIIRDAFTPTNEQVTWARRLLAEAGARGEAVFAFEGHMVDGPIFLQAQRILLRAGHRKEPGLLRRRYGVSLGGSSAERFIPAQE